MDSLVQTSQNLTLINHLLSQNFSQKNIIIVIVILIYSAKDYKIMFGEIQYAFISFLLGESLPSFE